MKVFITKYALTRGIFEAEAEMSKYSPGMVIVPRENLPHDCFHVEGREWHRTIESARAKANLMVAEKIKSLKKQLVLLEKKKF